MTKNGNLGFVEAALDRTKAYHNSNILRHYDAVLVPGKEYDLGNFAQQNNAATRKSLETLNDDRLKKYSAKKMLPTRNLNEIEASAELYLISDAKGFDIGIYNAETGEFTLSPKIKEQNRKMIAQVKGAEGIEKEFEEPSFGDVLDKLAKGESLVLTTEEQVKEEVVKNKQEEFKLFGGQEFDIGSEDEMSEEEELLKNVPEGAKPEILRIKEKMPGVQIKEVLIVNSPSSLTDSIGKESGINPEKGPVVLVRAVGKGAELTDDLYMFQDEQELPRTQENEQNIFSIMEQHKGEGVVEDFRDTEKERIIDKIETEIYNTELKVEELANSKFESEEAKSKAIAKEYEDLGQKVHGQIKVYDREEDPDLQNIEEAIEVKEEQAQNDELDTNNQRPQGGRDRGAEAFGPKSNPFNPFDH